MISRWIRRLLMGIGFLLILIGVGYGSTIAYFSWREQVSPSTQRMLVLNDGRQILFVQPGSVPPVSTPGAASEESTAASDSSSVPQFILAPIEPQLPPLRIVIPKIAVDWPVVLSDNDHMPQFRGVGWLMGSGFPGAAGNMVLFGHLDGPHGTFMRLHELQPGDEFSVFTQAGERRYQVRSSRETTPDDVGVLVPTSTASATLITCSGPWDPVTQTNKRRLIIIAKYIG